MAGFCAVISSLFQKISQADSCPHPICQSSRTPMKSDRLFYHVLFLAPARQNVLANGVTLMHAAQSNGRRDRFPAHTRSTGIVMDGIAASSSMVMVRRLSTSPPTSMVCDSHASLGHRPVYGFMASHHIVGQLLVSSMWCVAWFKFCMRINTGHNRSWLHGPWLRT